MVSSVTAIHKTEKDFKKKNDVDEGDSTKGDNESEERGDPTKSCFPGVSFWIGINVPDSVVPSVKAKLMQMFGQCGFAIFSCRVIIVPITSKFHIIFLNMRIIFGKY